MSKKMKAVDATEVVDLDLPPVELDPPDPAITRWQELRNRDYAITHDGDAELVMPFPRPAWADPDRDGVGECAIACNYKSKVVRVSASRSSGSVSENRLVPANTQVWATVDYDKGLGVGVATQKHYGDDGWRTQVVVMTVAEALELADVLRAAVDMLGGDDR